MRARWLLVSFCCVVGCSGGSGKHSALDAGTKADASTTDVDPLDATSPAEECQRYIDCAREATPTGVTSLIATYGDEGTCWGLPGVAPEDCGAECAAGRSELFALYKSAACGECQDHGDCEVGLCVSYACTTIGTCTCPAGLDCGGDDGDGDGIDIPAADGEDLGGLEQGEACGDGMPCREGLVCASYRQGPRACMQICTVDASCRSVCSTARDSAGRGLCIACNTHSDCGNGQACRDDGSCGCVADEGCNVDEVCEH